VKDLFFLTILFFVVVLWAGGTCRETGAIEEPLALYVRNESVSNPTPPNLIFHPVKGVPSPTPTPSGRWVYYKSGGATYYEETGNPTALGNEYITGPMDSLAAVDREDRWLLEKWLLVRWDGGEFVVWAGDICGKCAECGVAVDLSPGLYDRQFGEGPTPLVDIYYWVK